MSGNTSCHFFADFFDPHHMKFDLIKVGSDAVNAYRFISCNPL